MAKKRPHKTAGRGARNPRKVVREQLARERARRRAFIAGGVAVALLVVSGIVGWYVYQSQRPDRAEVVLPAGADASGVRVGSGPATVDVYLDFMCPHCKTFETAARDTLSGLVAANKVTVVYHPVAFLNRFSTTEYSTRSAAASGCAADEGKFLEYMAQLYEAQPPEGGPGLPDSTLTDLAGRVAIDINRFGQCLRDEKHVAWVDGVTERATRRGVSGTPTVFVNGRPVQPDPEAIKAAVG